MHVVPGLERKRQGFSEHTIVQSHLTGELLGHYDPVSKEVDNIPQDDIEVDHWLPQAHKFMHITGTNKCEKIIYTLL